MAYIIGVGMTKFEKPLARKWDYPDMGREAGQLISPFTCPLITKKLIRLSEY